MQIKKQHKVKRPYEGTQMVNSRGANHHPSSSGYVRDSSSGSRGAITRVTQNFYDDGAYHGKAYAYSNYPQRSGKTRYFQNQLNPYYGNGQAHGGLSGYRRMQNGRPYQGSGMHHYNQQNSQRQQHIERVQHQPPPVMTHGSEVCSELYDINSRSDAFHYDPYFL